MTELNPIEFLLNQSDATTESVSSPASLTRVMATAASVLTPVVAVITEKPIVWLPRAPLAFGG